MKVLLIEDDENLVDLLIGEFSKPRPAISLAIARSRDTALSAIENELYDLVICDLNIPTEDDALDLHVDHGLAVQAQIMERLPGTPVIILSGFATLEMMEELIQAAKQSDIFGNNDPIPMLQYLHKAKLHDCVDRIASYSIEIQRLEDIVIDAPPTIDLHQAEIRLIRIFSRRLGGAIAKVVELPGGLSGSRTFLVDVLDGRNRPRGWSIAKIGEVQDILDERDRVRTVVTPMLLPGHYAPEIDFVEVGLGTKSALFYRRAEQFDRTLFNILSDDPTAVPSTVELLREIENPWIESSSHDQFTVHEIRSWFADNDEVAEELTDHVDWRALEARSVVCHMGCQHGDLHPGNILVNRNGEPLLIDFGKTSDNLPLATDPIYLELSLFFHPWGREIVGDWPNEEDLSRWPDLDNYIVNCPVPGFIIACRQWANDLCSNYRELLVVAYAVGFRQLRFKDTDKGRVYSLIRALESAFDL